MKYTKEQVELLKIGAPMMTWGIMLENYISALDEIKRLQSENEWIPVSERLPLPAQKADGYYSDSSDLVHVYPAPKNDRAVCYLHYLEKWSCSAEVNVTHWRPLPQPPEVSG